MADKIISSAILALFILVALLITRYIPFNSEGMLFGFLVSYAISYAIVTYIIPGDEKPVIAFDIGGVLTSGDYYTEKLRENKDTMALVDRLKSKHYKTAILSNQNAEVYSLFEKKFKYNKIFDEQIVSGRVGAKKPDPKIYAATIQKLGVTPNRIVFVDDQEENVAAAKKMGLNAIQFKSAQQLQQELKKLGIES